MIYTYGPCGNVHCGFDCCVTIAFCSTYPVAQYSFDVGDGVNPYHPVWLALRMKNSVTSCWLGFWHPFSPNFEAVSKLERTCVELTSVLAQLIWPRERWQARTPVTIFVFVFLGVLGQFHICGFD